MTFNTGSKPVFKGFDFEGDSGNDFKILDLQFEKGWTKNLHSKKITALAKNISGDVIGTGSEDNYIKIFSLTQQKELLGLYNQERVCLSLDFHAHNPDVLLSGNNNGVVNVWALRSKKAKFSFSSHREEVNTVKFYSEKKCYSGSKDRTMRLWDIGKGGIITTYMCYSPCICSDTDGYMIYSGHKDGSLKMWAENKSTPIIDTKIHGLRMSHLKISSDGNSIVINKSNSIRYLSAKVRISAFLISECRRFPRR